jgi:hypothetical protein
VFVFLYDDNVANSGFKFCPFCGKQIEAIEQEDEPGN